MNFFDGIVTKQKNSEPIGITSICSAHPEVLETAMRFAKENDSMVLIESTCNQVNQYGGYTGMKPSDFISFLRQLAEQNELPFDRLIIGGDHLGPNVWRKEPHTSAMEKARDLVKEYIKAGYQKIHIDTSMACSDDPQGEALEPQIIAERTADLISVCEASHLYPEKSESPIRYVIGTEVPTPGGMQGSEEIAEPTKTEFVQETIELMKKALENKGILSAWDRIIAIVVQPGVEFGDHTILDYDPERAKYLAEFIHGIDGLVYEAHSTDYQTNIALENLVKDHFAILKVGPELTYAYREAIYALAIIENELSGIYKEWHPSLIKEIIESEMCENPGYWQDYYQGTPEMKKFACHYSYSDRVRYYWTNENIKRALDRLSENLGNIEIPLSLLSQYMPDQYLRIRSGSMKNNLENLIQNKIVQVLEKYWYACTNDQITNHFV